ncbi:MAG: hypothetical protein ACYTFW_23965, partial [Planctomycetota bacterium]
MRKQRIAVLCFGILVSFINHSTAQETKEITCTVKVVDLNAQPVLGAEVVAYEYIWDSSVGQIRLELLGKGKTDADGLVVMNVNVANKRDRCFL